MSERDGPRVPHLLDGDGDAGGGDAGDASSLMRAALRGARADVPDAAKMNALSAAIAGAVTAGGGGGGGGGEPPGTGGSEPGATAGGGGGVGAAPSAAGAVGATKLALGGAAVVAAIGVAFFATRAAPVEVPADAGPTTMTTASAIPTALVTASATASAAAAGNEPVLDVHALPAAAATDAGRTAASAPGTGSARPAGSPDAEMTLLGSAQAALSGAPAEALARCEEHARTYPGGAFADEREVLAVDALIRLGRRSEAEARAARFRVAHPGSAYLRRLDTLLGTTD